MKSARSRAFVFFACLATAAMVAGLSAALGTRVLFNRTASLPRGFYWLQQGGSEQLGPDALVSLPIPKHVLDMVVERHYLPSHAVLVKHVLAAKGDVVCTAHNVLTVNGKILSSIRQVDSSGRVLPVHQICRPLHASEVFVGAPNEYSFDSRNFGPVHRENLSGKVVPLWMF